MAGGRPKKPPLGQSSIYDRRLEDPELEGLLDSVYANLDAYKAYINTRKAIKELMQRAHPRLIVGFLNEGDPLDDEEDPDPDALANSGYVLVGKYRILASAPRREAVPAGTKQIPARPASHGWKFDCAIVDTTLPAREQPPEAVRRRMSVNGEEADVAVSPTAAALIDEARRAPATAADATAQADAAARLARRSADNGN